MANTDRGALSAYTRGMGRGEWLLQDDARLLEQCDVDTYRASGPGGQKRNKTDSAVRLRHSPSGISVIAEESRSQHENKARALRRLRAALAIQLRAAIDPAAPVPDIVLRHRGRDGRVQIGHRHDDYWPLMAVLLDVLAAANGEVRRAAGTLGLTTGQYSSLLTDEDKVLAEANRIRRVAGLRALTR